MRKHGGVIIFVHESLTTTHINLCKFCNDFDLEASAVKVKTKSDAYCIICIYRPLAGDFSKFINHLDLIVSHLHSPHTNTIVCGDFNINYLQFTSNKNQLDSIIALYNLYAVVDFPTRITINSSTAIDNFFVDMEKTPNIPYTQYTMGSQTTMPNS